MVDNDNIDNNNSVEQDWQNREGVNNWNNFLDENENREKQIVEWNTNEEAENMKDDMIKQSLDKLQNKIGTAFEKADVTQDTKDKLDRFFDKSKEELTDDKYSVYELPVKLLMKTNRFKNRSEWAVDNIVKSANKIENEINNWKDETNPVARSLLKIVRWIMWTEK